MTKSQKDKRKSSGSANSNSTRLSDERLILKMEKEQLKQAARQREKNIATSTAELSQKAIKATDTSGCIEDEYTAHEVKQAEMHTTRCQQMDTLLRDQVFTIHTDHLNLTCPDQISR